MIIGIMIGPSLPKQFRQITLLYNPFWIAVGLYNIRSDGYIIGYTIL